MAFTADIFFDFFSKMLRGQTVAMWKDQLKIRGFSLDFSRDAILNLSNNPKTYLP